MRFLWNINPCIQELFEDLLPVNIQEALNSFNQKKEEIITTEINRLNEGNITIEEFWNSTNLSAASENLRTSGIPVSLTEKSNVVIKAGGLEKLVNLVEELSEHLKRNTDILCDIEHMVLRIQESDYTFKSQYGIR